MFPISLHALAQVAAVDEPTPISFWVDTFPRLVDRIGMPILILLAIAWAISKISKWEAPKIDDWISASIEKQRAVTKELENTSRSLAELAQETKRIQAVNAETLDKLGASLGTICRFKCMVQPTRSNDNNG